MNDEDLGLDDEGDREEGEASDNQDENYERELAKSLK